MSLRQSKPVVIAIATVDIAEIRIDPANNHRSLYSRKEFRVNELISEFTAKGVYPNPSYLTVQISDEEHIELFPECLECINHSCDPNCFFDTTKMQLVSLKRIKEGEELTFFYPSTEWDMDQAFQCFCRNKNCIGMIQGAKYLSESIIKNYRFTHFIEQKLDSRHWSSLKRVK